MRIEFNEERHEYTVTVDGKPPAIWPNVTQILGPVQNFGDVPADILKRAQDFGIAVHKTVELYNNQDLDETTLDPVLAEVLAQYKTALSFTGWKVLGSEIRVGHPALGYVGTLDIHAVDPKGHHCLVDVKTGNNSKTVGVQTMAYVNAYTAMEGITQKFKRYCLFLKRDTYRLLPLKDDHGDWSVFVSCLNIHRFKEKVHGTARAAA